MDTSLVSQAKFNHTSVLAGSDKRAALTETTVNNRGQTAVIEEQLNQWKRVELQRRNDNVLDNLFWPVTSMFKKKRKKKRVQSEDLHVLP